MKLPTIYVDTREKYPLVETTNIQSCKRHKLEVGDYSLRGYLEKITCEYKSKNDWLAWLSKAGAGRFTGQVNKLRPYAHKCILVTAPLGWAPAFAAVSSARIIELTAQLTAWDIPVIFCPDLDRARQFLLRWLEKARDMCDMKAGRFEVV